MALVKTVLTDLKFVAAFVFIFVIQRGREEVKGQGPTTSPEQLLRHTSVQICFERTISGPVFQETPGVVNLSTSSLK